MGRRYDVTVRLADGTSRVVRVATNARANAREAARWRARNETGVEVEEVLRVAYVPAQGR